MKIIAIAFLAIFLLIPVLAQEQKSASPDVTCGAMVQSSSVDASLAADLLKQIIGSARLDNRLLLSAEKWKEAKLLELRRIATSNPGEGNLGKCAIALSEASKWKSDLIVIFRLDEELRDRQLALKVPDINTTICSATWNGTFVFWLMALQATKPRPNSVKESGTLDPTLSA